MAYFRDEIAMYAYINVIFSRIKIQFAIQNVYC